MNAADKSNGLIRYVFLYQVAVVISIGSPNRLQLPLVCYAVWKIENYNFITWVSWLDYKSAMADRSCFEILLITN